MALLSPETESSSEEYQDTVSLDRNQCVGCGYCEISAPEVFRVDQEYTGLAFVHLGGVALSLATGQELQPHENISGRVFTEDEILGVIEAVELCPSETIVFNRLPEQN